MEYSKTMYSKEKHKLKKVQKQLKKLKINLKIIRFKLLQVTQIQ